MLVLCPGQIGQFVGVGFCGWKKTGEPGEKPSEQDKNPHMARESNPGHTFEGRALSPLHQRTRPTLFVPPLIFQDL